MISLKSLAEELLVFLMKRYNIRQKPKLEYREDPVNSKKLLGKTAHYDPDSQIIVIYSSGRHPKDILRSIAHEFIHHVQNLNGAFKELDLSIVSQNGYEQKDKGLYKIEEEAFSKGNMLFREWEAMKKEEKNKQLNESKNPVKEALNKFLKKKTTKKTESKKREMIKESKQVLKSEPKTQEKPYHEKVMEVIKHINTKNGERANEAAYQKRDEELYNILLKKFGIKK